MTMRFFSIAQVLLLLITLTACGGSGGGDSHSPSGPVITRDIAFISGNQLLVMDSAGASFMLNFNDGYDYLPTWSPDGTKIAVANVDPIYSSRSIELVRADGSGRMTIAPREVYDLDYSPDGRYLVATVQYRGICRYATDRYFSEVVLDADGQQPVWSPDGTRIAYLSASGISIMNADGTNKTLLNSIVGWSLKWSPDGGKIAFVTNIDGNYEIYIMNADGSGLANLTQNPGSDSDPNWSPDGKKIAFFTNRDGNYEIYVMNPDGTNEVNLTNNPASDSFPTWSPDSREIAFLSDRQSGSSYIHKMNADGTNQRIAIWQTASSPTWRK